MKNFKTSISPQLRVPEVRTTARLKGLVLGFHSGQVSPCRRAGACSNNIILLGFVAPGLAVEGYVVGFFY